MRTRAPWSVLVLCALLAPGESARADEREPSGSSARRDERATGAAVQRTAEDEPSAAKERAQEPALPSTLALLAARRLGKPEAESVDELDAVLDEAHQRALAGRKDEATMLLLEAVEGPRFRAFESLDSFAAAELALAGFSIDQHALATAQRSVERLLARGTTSRTFGPAYRHAVDVALLRRDYARAAERLSELVPGELPSDARSELAYLRALAAYDAGREAEAERELAAVTKSSRFYPSAQYLLGAIAARARKFAEADQHFCAVRTVAKNAPRALYASGELVPSDDEARLALGRIAHEQGRSKQAFDHYFSVPADSPLLAEALFEAAYANYERGHHTTALDSLDQLEARYPSSPFRAEAHVLRGYAHLGRCDFERAERELIAFEASYGEALRELDAALASPARAHALYEDAREARSALQDGAQPKRYDSALLESLVARDPEVERLRVQLAALDAELARSAHTGRAYGELAARVRSGEAKHARNDEASDEAKLRAARARLADVRSALNAFGRELRGLRRAGAERAAVAELEASERTLLKQSEQLEARLRALVRARRESAEPPVARELAARLDQEQRYVEAAHARAERVRDDLASALANAERDALLGLRERLAKELRRARIGRIDAVMGKKRKLELEVESLNAGRFPPELPTRTQKPVLLRDDEEYWPFEGEAWSDEGVEPRAKGAAR